MARALAATAALAVAATCAAQDHRGWRVYGGDYAGSKYSELAQIDRSNVQTLTPAWVFRSGDHRRGSTIECNPIVIGRVLYLTTPSLVLVAVDAATGQERWRFDPSGGRGVNRGVAYWAGSEHEPARIFYAAGRFLLAIDANTGELLPSFGDSGRVDLREGMDQDVFYMSVSATSPGIVFEDLLIMGCRVGEGPAAAAPGHIRAYDVRTGKRRWIFHTIPRPGEHGHDTWPADAWKTAGGANCWSGFTLDAERGIVFLGTGSPTYDHYGGDRPGTNLFGNCVLALDARTGERRWHFQVVHHDIWDYDIPCPPNLVTVRRGGELVDAVAQATKMGHLFVLDRVTGRPIFDVEERPVPKSTLAGEQSWPTQPFPAKPPAYAQQRFTTTDRSPAARARVEARLAKMRTGDVFLPPGLYESVALPQFNGGTNWGGAAFDPTTRTLYVNASNEAEWISMVPARPQTAISQFELGKRLYRASCAYCHATDSGVSLADAKSRLTKDAVLEVIAKGKNQMPGFEDGLSEQERAAIVAFLFGEGRRTQIAKGAIDSKWADKTRFVATGHRDLRDPDGYPVNKLPWGTLTAIDLDAGEIRWQVPLGTYPKLEKQLGKTGTFNMGGPLVTAGGLVFIGAAMDERFHAFDARTGELVWEYQLDAGGYATPATYEVDGRQFVVIAAGGGGKPGTRSGDAYYCFALPEK